jgi:hypothetical protein
MEYLFFGFIGLIAATVVAAILAVSARKYLPPSIAERRHFIRRCIRTPFLGWTWVLLTWIVYSYVLGHVFDRDNGMSTDWHAPMPNGYTVGNYSYSFGYLLGPSAKPDSGYPNDSPNSVAAITYLQESEPYLLGSRYLSEWEKSNPVPTSKKYFIVDTRSREILRFDTMDELISAAAAKGVTVEFGEQWGGWCWEAYRKYRPIWFDWFFPIVSIGGVVYLLISLLVSGKRLRSTVPPPAS